MDEENELKASFQKLSKIFFYLIGQRVYLSIKVGKKVSKGAFSVIQLIFADSRISHVTVTKPVSLLLLLIFD